MKGRLPGAVFTIIVLVTGLTYGQSLATEPQTSITNLIQGLQKAAIAGTPVAGFFSPDARIGEKGAIESLQTKGFLKFEFVDYTFKDLRLQDEMHATLPVTVKWSTRNEDSSRTATLKFVRDQGVWYFAEADFWEFSLFWFFPIIAYAVCYGCGVVTMYRHSSRQQWADSRRKFVWQVLTLVPFSLFLYFAKKPWTQPFRTFNRGLVWLLILYWVTFIGYTIKKLVAGGPNAVFAWYAHISGMALTWNWKLFLVRQAGLLAVTFLLILFGMRASGKFGNRRN